MVDYLYTGNYADTIDPDISNTVDNSSILSVHAAMCALADKYGIQGLADLSTSKYGKALQKIPDLKSFILSVPHVYGSKSQTSPGLRDWAVAFAREKIPAHLSDPEIKRDFDRCISENREFMQDMLYSALLHPLIGVCFNCGPVTPADTYQCRCKDCSETGAVIGEHMDRN